MADAPPDPESSREAFARTAPAPSDHVATELARTILPTSGAMIGVCATLVGLVKLNERQSGPSVVDEYGSLIAIAFLASAVTSYLSIRIAGWRLGLARKSERVADLIFIGGLFCLVALATVFAFEIV